jgi:hypothetical protein
VGRIEDRIQKTVARMKNQETGDSRKAKETKGKKRRTDNGELITVNGEPHSSVFCLLSSVF